MMQGKKKYILRGNSRWVKKGSPFLQKPKQKQPHPLQLGGDAVFFVPSGPRNIRFGIRPQK